ncbi:phage portal protein [Roseovarius sp. MMSF_3350]|uniref:phage portal protein n=1 Tax=Roseovarius sp. MMSF_3350 TaxID=3046706 RepID=UPI00273ED948|nr:phage portal protein [Roseovarius sp. MMSF_3350]
MFDRLFGNRATAAEAVRAEPVLKRDEERRPANLQSGASFEEWQEFFPFLGASSVNRDTAMKLVANYACVTLLAGTIGTMSVRVVQKNDRGGTDVLSGHPVHALVNDEPSPMWSPEVFFEGIGAVAFLDGNSYAEIARNRRGEVVELRPMFDARVKPFKKARDLFYSVTEDGETRGYVQDDVLHLRGSATMQGFEALSPLKCFARSIGIGLQADEYAEKFYKQGVNPPGYISFEGRVDEQMANEIREYWTKKFGGVANSHIPAVLSEKGMFHKLVTDPETAQLFQSRSFQVLDVARAYGVPPHLIGETDKSTSWGTGINAQTAQFYILGLRRHVKRFETELSRKLLTREERRQGISVEINMDSLLRADLAARYDAHKVAVGGTQHPAWLTVNEVREMEGRTKSDDPEADKLYRPVAKSTGTDAGEDQGGGSSAPQPGTPLFQTSREGQE